MNVDYYALLKKAIEGKDAAARERIYRDASGLIRRSHLSREAASSHAAALEGAIRRIEAELAAEDVKSAAEINEVLSTDRNWKPLFFGASVVVAVIALSALLYGYVGNQRSRWRRRDRVIVKGTARSRRRRHGGPQARRGWRLHERRLAVRAAAAGGVLPQHRRSRIDRGRSGKTLSLPDRFQ